MHTRILLAAIAATALVACGGDPTPTGSGAADRGPDAATRKALLDHARCMREHGVDMPDPKFGEGGRVTQMRRGPEGDPEKLRAAETACKHFTDAIKPPAMSAADREEFRKRALANARCMREHGIDMPDPTFDENGGAQMRIGRDSGIRPDDPKFQEAQKACGDLIGGPGRTRAEEGGG